MTMPPRATLWLAAAALSGCGSRITTLEVDGQANTEIPGATLVETLAGDLGFGSFVSMDITEAEELQNQGVEPGDIRDVRLVSFELEAIQPSDADLSFINDMQILVEGPDLPSERVASADSFPEGDALVVFDLSDLDLTEYVVSESMTLTTEADGRRPDEDTVVQARYLLEVGVTLRGATRKRE